MKKAVLAVFWSPFHGQTGQTSNLAALGTYIGIKYNIRTLLMHSQFTKSNLENAFFNQGGDALEALFDEKGIDALERLAMTRQLSSANFTDYTTVILSERLEILNGTSRKIADTDERMADTLPYILSCAKQSYDLILLDVNSGMGSKLTGIALNYADLIIVNLNQNMEVLKAYFKAEDIGPLSADKERLVLLGNYDRNSKYNARYIRRIFNYEDEIYAIPRNTAFMDEYNDHNVLRYIFANYEVDSWDGSHEFMEMLEAVSKRIVEVHGINVSGLVKPLRQKTFFGVLNIFGNG
jgi:hypothetical protein